MECPHQLEEWRTERVILVSRRVTVRAVALNRRPVSRAGLAWGLVILPTPTRTVAAKTKGISGHWRPATAAGQIRSPCTICERTAAAPVVSRAMSGTLAKLSVAARRASRGVAQRRAPTRVFICTFAHHASFLATLVSGRTIHAGDRAPQRDLLRGHLRVELRGEAGNDAVASVGLRDRWRATMVNLS